MEIDDIDLNNKELVDKDFEALFRRVYHQTEAKENITQYKLGKFFGSEEKKKSYSQNWPLYEKACSQEKIMFLKIIKEAVDQIGPREEYKGNGRPAVDYGDIIKSLCIKGYNNISSWRTESELRIAKSFGVIQWIHKRSTLNKYMKDEALTPWLHKIYQLIAEPLNEVEVDFAIDATGFSNGYGNATWSKVRHTKIENAKKKDYTKLHIITGVKTNVICTAILTEGTKHESPFFIGMLNDTLKRFKMKEISADAGYISYANVNASARAGVIPFIMPKKTCSSSNKGPMSPWNLIVETWKYNKFFFAEHYHKRSNVESTFSALKRKFGDSCRCKDFFSRHNEILCRIICYNAAVLAEALLSYDLNSKFVASL
jgi:transposase